MPTNLALDGRLIEQAVKIGNHKTKREAVNAALLDYVNAKKRRGILDLEGRIDFDPGMDLKKMRRPPKR
jgi:Arc/MetJ family transcription regulator